MANAGMIINGENTLDKYGLMLLADYTISSPVRKKNIVSVPAANGSLNLSLDVNGQPVYEDISGSFTLFKSVSDRELSDLREILMDKYHGRTVQVILPFDLNHYYEGMLEFGDMSQFNSGRIPVSLTAFPYKFDVADSLGDWLWDPFSFESGIARDYSELFVDEEAEYTIIGSPLPVSPTFIVKVYMNETITMQLDGKSYEFETGTYTIPGLFLKNQPYTMRLSGVGTVSVQFRGGVLR